MRQTMSDRGSSGALDYGLLSESPSTYTLATARIVERASSADIGDSGELSFAVKK